MTQVFLWRTANTGALVENPIFGNPLNCWGWQPRENLATIVCPANGTLGNLQITTDDAPSAGVAFNIELYINGVASGLAVSISGSGTTDIDTGSVAVAAGDRLVLVHTTVFSGSPVHSRCRGSIDFNSTTSHQSIYAGGSQDGLLASRSTALLWPPENTNWTNDRFALAGVHGVFDRLYVLLQSDPAPGGYMLTIGKNGVLQDGSGGTPDTRVTVSSGNTQANGSFSLSVVPGDRLTIRYDKVGSPTNAILGFGVRFTATTDGESHFGANPDLTGSTSNPNYYRPSGFGSQHSSFPYDTEAEETVLNGPTPFNLRGLIVDLDEPVTLGSWAHTLRVNSVDQALSVTVAAPNTTGSDPLDEVAIAAGASLSHRVTPNSTPTLLPQTYVYGQVFPTTPPEVFTDSLQAVTQYALFVLADEAAEDDPPAGEEDGDPIPCQGGGEVPAGTNPEAGTSLADSRTPLVWMQITIGETVHRFAASSINWGTPKYGRVASFGTITRALADGDKSWEAARITTTLIDTDRVLRGLANSGTLRNALVEYFIADLETIKDTSSPAAVPWRIFRGMVVDWEALTGLEFSLTSLDLLTARLTSTNAQDKQTPIKNTNDISDQNPEERMRDRATPEGYGFISDGFDNDPVWECKYVASITVAGHEELGNMHAFLVTLGVNQQIQRIWGASLLEDPPVSRVPIPESALGDWLFVPTMPGYFQADPWYESNGRRYQLIFGLDGHPVVELARNGRIPFIIDFCAWEEVGDGSGLVINSPARALLHWMNNRLVQDATGDWLDIASWGDHSVFDTETFEAVHLLTDALGFSIQGIIGADFSFHSWRDRVKDFCRNFNFQIGQNRHGQVLLTRLDRTLSGEGVPEFTPDNILEDSVRCDPREDAVENEIRYVYGQYHKRTLPDLTPEEGNRLYRDPYDGEWFSGLLNLEDEDSMDALGGDIDGRRQSEVQEYNLVRSASTASAIAQERLDLKGPPNGRYLATFDTSLRDGFDVELGDLVKARHWDLPWNDAFFRVLQVQKLVLDLDALTVNITAEDVDDLINETLTIGGDPVTLPDQTPESSPPPEEPVTVGPGDDTPGGGGTEDPVETSDELIFSTSFEGLGADVVQTPLGVGLSGHIAGITQHGGWTTDTGQGDAFLTAASRTGLGRGFRHQRGLGTNNNGSAIRVTLTEASARVWLRFYMRFSAGAAYAGNQPHYTKEIYWHQGDGNAVIAGFSNGMLYTFVSALGAPNILSSRSWAEIMGGSTGDGQWHRIDQHLDATTSRIMMWCDDDLVLNQVVGTLGRASFSTFLVGENQNSVTVAHHTDYDDIAVSITGKVP